MNFLGLLEKVPYTLLLLHLTPLLPLEGFRTRSLKSALRLSAEEKSTSCGKIFSVLFIFVQARAYSATLFSVYTYTPVVRKVTLGGATLRCGHLFHRDSRESKEQLFYTRVTRAPSNSM